jgi:hypothetical protein
MQPGHLTQFQTIGRKPDHKEKAMSARSLAEKALEQGRGILRLAPNWVPRSFCIPGRRIKLHPDDYYALGGLRGGIDERWLSSTIPADNGPLTALDEGQSFVVFEEGGKRHLFRLRDAVDEMQAQIIGSRVWNAHSGWPVYSKFFDNLGPLPHHVHHDDAHAALVNQSGKPEAYYFSAQLNNHSGRFPYTFFGLNPGTTREALKQCLMNFTRGDNRITSLSRAYRLDPGTGWDVPAGILHAPGSLCTYEPQKASDVYAMYQSLTDNQIVAESLLWKDTPKERVGDFEYLIELLDWEGNTDPGFEKKHFMAPVPVDDEKEVLKQGYYEKWICYRSDSFSAKELCVQPGKRAVIRDSSAYGMIMLQGHGRMGVWDIETPALIRYWQLTFDEFFVSEQAAIEGVTIENTSRSDPIVMLKHFAGGNPDLPEGLRFI